MVGKKKTHSNIWFYLIILIFAGNFCYALPYFKFLYYTPLQEALNLVGSNKKFGDLSSIYGILSMLFYIPGGWIADRFSPKKLLVFSMLATGGLGLYYSTWPSYPVVFCIHIAWAFTTVLTFWSAYIKIINTLSSSDEKSEAFGWLEGGRGIVSLISSIGGLWLFSYLGGKSNDLAVVFSTYSLIAILTGIAVYFYIPETLDQENKEKVAGKTIKLIFQAFKLPVTWMLGLTIFGTYTLLGGASYYSPYMETAFGLSAAMAGTIYTIRSNGIKLFSAPLYGYFSKLIGRTTLTIKWSYVFLTIVTATLIIIPAKPAFLWVMVFVTLLMSFVTTGIRGIYWVIIDEMETPEYIVGTVIGIASIVGFIPDAFIHTWFGGILDAQKGTEGFKKIFFIMAMASLISLVATFIADRMIVNKQKKKQKAIENNV